MKAYPEPSSPAISVVPSGKVTVIVSTSPVRAVVAVKWMIYSRAVLVELRTVSSDNSTHTLVTLVDASALSIAGKGNITIPTTKIDTRNPQAVFPFIISVVSLMPSAPPCKRWDEFIGEKGFAFPDSPFTRCSVTIYYYLLGYPLSDYQEDNYAYYDYPTYNAPDERPVNHRRR